ncbi:SHOCT domain-containing protein [Tropicimonas sp. TH_r6]|uniref:SHOCT domain-containing protein n=1 Tax=Tropicimonas sp. TH_r6 TaxID=3082085 RepID=UPI0029549669|nr:SHOCT domain-containing protein [Tropicimonas sp. TH_r6]MDV7143879.1 SHOCT domain-containing protein [Tropicimonas sp. TH_r6]
MDRFETYRALTEARDWPGICRLNGVELDNVGINRELDVLADFLEDGEVIFALTSGNMSQTDKSNSYDFGPNTWLVALTSERFLAIDHSMLTRSVAMHSIRHEWVEKVSAAQGWMLGKVIIDLRDHSVVIRVFQKASAPVFTELAGRWLATFRSERRDAETATPSPIDQLEKLGALKSSGVLSEEEFEARKRKILEQM